MVRRSARDCAAAFLKEAADSGVAHFLARHSAQRIALDLLDGALVIDGNDSEDEVIV